MSERVNVLRRNTERLCGVSLFSPKHIGEVREPWTASSHWPIAVLPLRLQNYFTAPVRRAFEHLVRLTGFVEPEHFATSVFSLPEAMSSAIFAIARQ